MKRIRITLWLVILPAIATLSFAARAAAQTVVVGTGNPDIDIPAVQAAVDQGGDVVLKGHFSFDRSPTIPTAPAGYPPATVLVSKAVAISGARDDDDGELTSIQATDSVLCRSSRSARLHSGVALYPTEEGCGSCVCS
jgi:hypothetical protein